MAYVQFTRHDFESWLTSVNNKWKLKPGTTGIYIIPLSDTVAVEVSSSMTGRGDVVEYAGASMGAKLVSLVTGFTLNKVAQGQDHVKRTDNWRINLGKVIGRLVDAYQKSSAFYDALATIRNRDEYKRENLEKIEKVPDWARNEFLKSLHDRLSDGGILSAKQLDALDRASSRPAPSQPSAPEVNQKLLGQVRALYVVGKERNNTWLMDFAKSVGELIKAGRDRTPRQTDRLNGLLDEHADAIKAVLRRSPNLARTSSERVASKWARSLFRSDPVEYERVFGFKYTPPGVYC